VIVIRHAQTDGAGSDPADFDIALRQTQRNLSEAGIAQARKIGEVFAARHVPVGRVVSSQYFRCRDTAALAFGEQRVERDPALNSLPDADNAAPSAKRDQQLAALHTLINAPHGGGNLVLVTHKNNQFGLFKQISEMGDALVIEPAGDAYTLVGTLPIASASPEKSD
jgi:broad specificity phosphatase PhoE